MPNIQIPLGISLAAQPSIKALRRRAQNRAEVAAANQPDLAFLSQGDFAETFPLVVVDGNFAIEAPLPRQIQAPLFPEQTGDGVIRVDASEELVIRQVLSALTVSSQVLDEVANLMATSRTLKHDIREFERSHGVNTGPARTFVYQKQEGFDVTVDGEAVSFNSHIARAAAPKGDPVHVLFTPDRPKSEGFVTKGRVDATHGDNRQGGVQSGGIHGFRFGLLEPWQAALIDVAAHFEKKILVTADETDSTCSLNPLPTAVIEVHNWAELLETALLEFSRVARLYRVAPAPPERPVEA